MNVSLETVLRCLDLVPIVRENQGIRLAELARRVNLPEKTIVDQLIPSLMLCGAPPYMPHDYINMWLEGDSVFVSFADHFRRPVALLPMELTALHLALSTLSRMGHDEAALNERITGLKEKIKRALPEEQRGFLAESARLCVNVDPDAGSTHLPVIEAAVESRKRVEIEYLSFGQTRSKRRVIHPYGVLVQDGQTYVVSFDEARGHVVSFRLDRVLGASALGEHFEVQPGFSLEKLIRQGLFSRRGDDEVEIRVRVSGNTARIVSETVDPKLWEVLRGGDLLVRFPTSRLSAAVRWVFSLGADAVIEAPEAARAIAAEELRNHLAVYA